MTSSRSRRRSASNSGPVWNRSPSTSRMSRSPISRSTRPTPVKRTWTRCRMPAVREEQANDRLDARAKPGSTRSTRCRRDGRANARTVARSATESRSERHGRVHRHDRSGGLSTRQHLREGDRQRVPSSGDARQRAVVDADPMTAAVERHVRGVRASKACRYCSGPAHAGADRRATTAPSRRSRGCRGERSTDSDSPNDVGRGIRCGEPDRVALGRSRRHGCCRHGLASGCRPRRAGGRRGLRRSRG